jgi:tetratricopeptide (TPR) repeat protein
MPRWLSEGISVYEERQANPSWGERLNPRYREMLLGPDLTPVSKLSAAFLAPKSSLHLQFAYYESSLVVEFIVNRFGASPLGSILRELGEGTDINDALEKHTVPMQQLESEFETFAREIAKQMAPGLDWEKPGKFSGETASIEEQLKRPNPFAPTPPPRAFNEEGWTAWAKSHPTNYWVMTREADRLLDQKSWPEAKALLETLVKLYSDSTGPDSAYPKLAAAYRALGEKNAERQILARFAEKDDTATDAYLRLMELGSETQDWPAVLQNASRFLAVDPMVAPPYRFLARASEAAGQTQPAIDAYAALLLLDSSNPAELHYHLAKLLHQSGDPAAHLHVLQALEEAPRFRDSLRLFRQMHQEQTNTTSRATAALSSFQ